MDDFLKMDIFFGVATVAAIALTALASIALMYVIRILRTIDRIASEVADEAKALKADFTEARKAAKKGGSEFLALLKAIGRYARRMLSTRKRS